VLAPHEPGFLERRIIRILQEKYVKTMPTESMRIRIAREKQLEHGREVRYLDRGGIGAPKTKLVRALLAGVTKLPLSLPFLFRLLDRATLGDRYADLFQREKPALVLTPTTGIYFGEGPLMGRADAEHVPILAIDLSWDHFTTKTAPLRRVDALTVWNETMKRQAVEIHGYKPQQVCMAGVPQFDIYADPATFSTREAFLARIGADPAKKLVTLTTIPPVLYAYHDVAIDEILAAMRRGKLGGPAQLLVRVHPRDNLATYERFMGQPDIIVEKPFKETIVAEGSNIDPSRENRNHLANTLKHSDVIVNVASTIAIEAAVMDTPIVNIGFDGHDTKPFLDSSRRLYQYTHYKPLVDAGAVRVAETPAAMIEEVAAYLADPSRDRAGRARVAEELCYRVDGRAAERVASFVLDRLAKL
jgi:CDP-glycerol:poly(glycerophosphate) glycerophosphotransferase